MPLSEARPTAQCQRRWLGFCSALLALGAYSSLTEGTAWAAPDDVVVRRTMTSSASVSTTRAEPAPELYVLAQRVDAILNEAVQDLGLTLDVSDRADLDPGSTEEELVERASDRWIVSANLERDRRGLVLRLSAIPPGSQVIFVRTQTLSPDELDMRVVLMMRDLVEAAQKTPRSRRALPMTTARPVVPAHSPGRAILALNAALLGGYAGYSLQQASGSEDDRLTYPLVALGAGVGLGGSMLAAEEWDIGVGDAWFVSAGMWWPTFSGLLLSESYRVANGDRYAYGLLGATAGLTLTTSVLGFGHVSEGGAALAHSGGAFGTLLGALTELTVEGRTNITPHRGMGYGAGGGLLAAVALLAYVEPSASRVLFIDLAASLGALTGAAAGSPFLLVEESEDDANRNRLFLASVAAGTLVGGVVGYFTTHPSSSAKTQRAEAPWIAPSVGVVEVGPRGPVLGATVRGAW